MAPVHSAHMWSVTTLLVLDGHHASLNTAGWPYTLIGFSRVFLASQGLAMRWQTTCVHGEHGACSLCTLVAVTTWPVLDWQASMYDILHLLAPSV